MTALPMMIGVLRRKAQRPYRLAVQLRHNAQGWGRGSSPMLMSSEVGIGNVSGTKRMSTTAS